MITVRTRARTSIPLLFQDVQVWVFFCCGNSFWRRERHVLIHFADAYETSKMLCEQYYLTSPDMKITEVNCKCFKKNKVYFIIQDVALLGFSARCHLWEESFAGFPVPETELTESYSKSVTRVTGFVNQSRSLASFLIFDSSPSAAAEVAFWHSVPQMYGWY